MTSLVDLDPSVRAASAALLQALLVDAIDLLLATKQAHWTVKGESFIALHELFDQIATRVQEQADEIAERILALGHQPDGTTQRVAASTRLKAYPASARRQAHHLAELAERLAAHGKRVRSDIDSAAEGADQGTADLLTGISRSCDKDLWLLEAHLEPQ